MRHSIATENFRSIEIAPLSPKASRADLAEVTPILLNRSGGVKLKRL